MGKSYRDLLMLSLTPVPICSRSSLCRRSWVRVSHADLDEPLRRAGRGWLDGPEWPFERIDYAAG